VDWEVADADCEDDVEACDEAEVDCEEDVDADDADGDCEDDAEVEDSAEACVVDAWLVTELIGGSWVCCAAC